MIEYRERIQLLMKLRDLIKANEKQIYEALKKDLGKSQFEAYETEVGRILTELNYTMKYLYSWMQCKTVPTPITHMPATSVVYRQAYGRVLIITPWNYPFYLTLVPLIHAIAAGNQVVLKPSEVAVHSEKVISEMLSQNFHTSRIRVMRGGPEVTMDLLEKKFDFIFFIGSHRVGKIVMEYATRHMTPVAMQMEGKTPCFVDENFNLKYAAKKIVWGKFINCGQSISAPDLVLVPEKKKDQFLEYVQYYITKFYGEEPLQSQDYGKIINLEKFYRLLDLLEHQEILIGGDFDTKQGRISPTVVAEHSFCSNMMKEDIFGPILPIMTYENWEDALEKLKRFSDLPAMYVFTKNKAHEEYIKLYCEAGSICINDVMMQVATPYLPVGGIGRSGMGRYGGKAGFDTFSTIKSVMKRSVRREIGLKYPPFAGKLNMLKRILK